MAIKNTLKQAVALDYIKRGYSKRQGMLKAGYSNATAKNPKKNLLEKAGTKSIVELMQTELSLKGVDGAFLAERLAEFSKSDNAKVFFGAYDRVSKILGIDSQQGGMKKREVTFTEWVNDKPQDRPTVVYEDHVNNEDLIGLDAIKVDRFGEPIVEGKTNDYYQEEPTPPEVIF